MTPEQAMTTAIEYETRIRDLYRDAAARISDPVGRQVLNGLGADEQRHIDYLNDRLAFWNASGVLEVKPLEETFPPRDVLDSHAAKLGDRIPAQSLGDEKLILSRALAVEVETSDFYQKMVETMDGSARQMFAQFLDIEKGHINAVQAELDYLSQTGYWFGFQEFDQEDG